MNLSSLSLDLASLRAAYQSGVTPAQVIEEVLKRIAASSHYHAWISVRDRAALLQDTARLNPADRARLPLYGVPFAIKDNIDLAGMETTAGCPAFAYSPPRSATLVERVMAAGAIPIGKNNMDQFAAGLVGTRTPYGVCHNAFEFQHVSGGSSSGSAVAVALSLVSFALATDTAGSGRVPAAFNNLVGVKPTRGILSTAGIFSACASISCPALFALNVSDAETLFELCLGRDDADPYTRDFAMGVDFSRAEKFRFGVPCAQDLQFFGNAEYARLFEVAFKQFRALGGEAVEISLQPFLEAARLLYDGPWIAERWEAVGGFAQAQPNALHPVTLSILQKGAKLAGSEIFTGLHRLQALRLEAEAQLRGVDFVLTPTAPTHPLIADVLQDPLRLNTQLGYYTNFMNLLDLAALAVPGGFTQAGLPFGLTLFAPAFADRALLGMARRYQAACSTREASTHKLGVPDIEPPTLAPGYVEVVVCGAHMAGLALNTQLITRGGYLRRRAHTAPVYRFYLLPGSGVQRPGLIRVAQDGAAIEAEVWAIPAPSFASFVAGIPAPLGIGKVQLQDGTEVPGFICEGYASSGAMDITHYGGWRGFLAAKTAQTG